MVSQGYPTTMESLPGQVLSEIFIRLLAKQLAQMRSVCKSWNALLSESSFVKSHLHHSVHNKERILLFFRPWSYFEDCNLLTVYPSRSPDLRLTNLIKFPVNTRSTNINDHHSVIGSVNGLICFYYLSYSSRFLNYVVYIWNPSLSALLTLPPCSIPASCGRKLHFRFGYDPKTDDYKVVKLATFFGYRMTLQAEVYSMRKGSWELISQRCPSHITQHWDDDAVCVDGHVHWLCFTDFTEKSQVMVTFDLGADTFREVSLPDSKRHRFNDLGVFSGKLCVVSCIEGGECEVWVMDEYGVAESWVKHHTFSQLSSEITPYGFTLNNEFFFQVHKDRCFAFYDPVSAETKTFEIKDVHGLYKFVEYVDSLVWIGPGEREISCLDISQFKI